MTALAAGGNHALLCTSRKGFGARLAARSLRKRGEPSRARLVALGALSEGEQGYGVNPYSEAEREANERRRLEAIELRKSSNRLDDEDDEEDDPFVGLNDWRWTLNYNEITPNIFVGACPRKPRDVDAIKEGTGCTALLCLQSHACFEALGIDHPRIVQRGGEVGVKVIHVPIRDFDHENQAEMIPEAARALNLLIKTGHKVYVHCTAGINRATLTVLSYLTFVEGRTLDEAYAFVKERRPQAHPYLDCWWTSRTRMLQGRSEEIEARSRRIYESRIRSCEPGTTGEDWFKAENELIMQIYKNKWEGEPSASPRTRSLTEIELGFTDNPFFSFSPTEHEVDSSVHYQMMDQKAEVNRLKSELNGVLKDAWFELERKEKLEAEVKHVHNQMKAMKTAFETLHTNLNRSCETIKTPSVAKTTNKSPAKTVADQKPLPASPPAPIQPNPAKDSLRDLLE